MNLVFGGKQTAIAKPMSILSPIPMSSEGPSLTGAAKSSAIGVGIGVFSGLGATAFSVVGSGVLNDGHPINALALGIATVAVQFTVSAVGIFLVGGLAVYGAYSLYCYATSE